MKWLQRKFFWRAVRRELCRRHEADYERQVMRTLDTILGKSEPHG